MKILKSIIICIALTACNVIDPEGGADYELAVDNGDIIVKVQDVLLEDETKTDIALDATTGLSFVWTNDDKVGVYTADGGMALFNIKSGQGANSAVFNGSGFNLIEGKRYYGLFPYNGSATDVSNILVDYSGRSVTSADNLQDLIPFDIMTSSAVADGSSHATFTFNHLSSFSRLILSFPKTETITSLDLIPTYGNLADALSLNLKTGVTSITNGKTVKNIPVNNIATSSLTCWIPMIPQSLSDMSIVINTASGAKYTARLTGKDLKAGKSYRWSAAAVKYPSAPTGFSVSAKATNSLSSMPSGQYSGITKISDTKYGVVHDSYKGGGIIFFDLSFNSDGSLLNQSYTIPIGTQESTVFRDPEGIVYVPSSNTLYVSGEVDQKILEYDMDGRPTGRGLNVPSDMAIGQFSGNYGFESLGYNANTNLFWTTTENCLEKDKDYSIDSGILIRLQSFNAQTLEPANRYLYMMDAPYYSNTGSIYAYGISDILALDDGRLIIMEREANPASKWDATTEIKLYLVDPVNDKGGILSKKLLYSTATFIVGWANYEGLCFGPVLSGKNTILMINDSQDRYAGWLEDYLKVLTF